MRQLSPTLIQATQAQHSDEVLLFLLEIEYDTGSYIRVVNNLERVTHNGDVYEPVDFRVTMPDEKDEGRNQTNLEIDNVDGSILLSLLPVEQPVPVVLKAVLASAPDDVEAGPFSFTMIDLTWDAATVSGTLVFEDILLEVYPGWRVTPITHPGAF